MTFLPPPPPEPDSYGTFVDKPPRWTADAQAAKLTIPYLGPEPPPSRPLGMALQAACGVLAVLWAARAAMFLWQASVEQDFLDHRTRALADQVRAGTDRLSMTNTLYLVLVLGLVVLELAWRGQRRPKRTRTNLGEAYVEFPLTWVTPIWMRLTWVALVVPAVLAGVAGTTNRTTLPADYPHHRQLSALSNVIWMVLWVSLALWVAMVNRAHRRRVAWSQPYRADPTQVPFFPAIAGMGVFETGRGPRSSAGGFGWMLRTSGLILVMLIGIGALIGGLAEIGHGHAAGLLWALGGGAMIAFVVWAMVRRYQEGRL